MSYGTLLATLVVFGLARVLPATATADPVVPELRAVDEAEKVRFERYVNQCIKHIEHYGNQHYPDTLLGKRHGDVKLMITIQPNGNVEAVQVIKSSNSRQIDQAAVAIVRGSAPLPSFPAEILARTGLIELERTFSFTTTKRLATKR